MAGAGVISKSSSHAHVVPGLGRLKHWGLERLKLLRHLHSLWSLHEPPPAWQLQNTQTFYMMAQSSKGESPKREGQAEVESPFMT